MPTPKDAPVRLLIVDDSAMVRRVLSERLNAKPGIEVVGAAPDPYVARDMVVKLKPDVITLDIEMPRMDGLTFLQKLMHFNPVPTIIVSSLAASGTKTAIACLESGAVDVMCKPSGSYSISEVVDTLAVMVVGAKGASLRKRPAPGTPASPDKPKLVANAGSAMIETTHKIIAIGASTGGTEALKEVLSALPPTTPGIVVVQHMPENFTFSFAERLNSMCQIGVSEAKDGDTVVPGHALIAPGNRHMQLVRSGARYAVKISEGPRVRRHRPSVEVLFKSVAQIAGANAFGGMLTGMGDDGAEGMLDMRNAGAYTVAQDEASCVVFGMPRVAIEKGAACKVVPLDRVAHEIVEFAAGRVKIAA